MQQAEDLQESEMMPRRPQRRKANTSSHVFVDVDVHVKVHVNTHEMFSS